MEIILFLLLLAVIYILAFWLQARIHVQGKALKTMNMILVCLSFLSLFLGLATPLNLVWFYLISVGILFVDMVLKYILCSKKIKKRGRCALE